MKIIRWTAVLVTAVFVLMNFGAAIDTQQPDWVRLVGALLAAFGVPAAVGLALNTRWGRPAVIAVGTLNVIAAGAALVADAEGGGIGLVVGGLAVVFGALATQSSRAEVTA